MLVIWWSWQLRQDAPADKPQVTPMVCAKPQAKNSHLDLSYSPRSLKVQYQQIARQCNSCIPLLVSSKMNLKYICRTEAVVQVQWKTELFKVRYPEHITHIEVVTKASQKSL